jgi:hypothetical protein
MRRVIGLILAGVGTFLIVCAVLLPTWVSSQVIKFPLNEYETATLQANNASYFSASTLTEKTGVTMQATYTIKGDKTKGSSSTAVWNEFAYVQDRTNHAVVQEMTRTFAFDRKTGQLVNCCGANINGDSSIQQRGYVGYVFPFGTKKQTYDIFDTTLNQPVPFNYVGTTTVRGIKTYHFTENVAPRQITTQAVPGSLIGMSAKSVNAPEFYEIHLNYYVDPDTGALVNVDEHQTLSLHNPDTGAQALLLFDADLVMTPSSLTTVVGLDNNGRNELNLITFIVPLVLGIAGAVALVAGILISRRRRPTMEDELDAMSRKLTATSADPERPASPRHAVSAERPPAPREPSETTAELAGVVPGMEADPPEAAAQPAESDKPEPPSGPAVR